MIGEMVDGEMMIREKIFVGTITIDIVLLSAVSEGNS
jgi:hypothetical protein